MGYCFMTIDKVKSHGALTSKYKHNYRIADVKNADKSLAHLNEELIALPTKDDGSQMTPNEVFHERINSLPYYKTHEVRKNAVLAMEVVTTFSRESAEFIDLEQWKKENVAWMRETFDVAPDKKSNILSMVYHGDEAGNVHCHALIMPIDENGKLNARRFTGGARIMSKHQDSYAKKMAQFGLDRGLKGSPARHKDIKKFYADLNRAFEKIPEKKPEETVEEYMERAKEQLKTIQAAHLRQLERRERKMLENVHTTYLEKREGLEREYGTIRVIKEQIEELNQEKSNLQKDIDELQDDFTSATEVLQILERQKKIDKSLKALEKEKPEFVNDYKEKTNFLLGFDENQFKIDSPEEELWEEDYEH